MKRLAVIFVVAILYSFAASRMPYGEWDAWARWNMMARQLTYHEPTALLTELTPFTGHLEYPPLLYVVQAVLLSIFGDTVLVPIVLHGAILLTITALIRPYWLALIVGMACVYYAAIQYADLPLALCFLCAAVAYSHKRDGLIGLALGIGALTKNEGALILVAFFAVWTIYDRRIHWRAVAGAAIPVALLVAWKIAIPEANDVVGSSGALERLLDWQRYAVIVPYVVIGLLRWSMGVVVFIGAIALLHRQRVDKMLLVTICLVWLGYVAIYVITPHDLQWHLETSYDRLIAQLFPALAYGFFCSYQTSVLT